MDGKPACERCGAPRLPPRRSWRNNSASAISSARRLPRGEARRSAASAALCGSPIQTNASSRQPSLRPWKTGQRLPPHLGANGTQANDFIHATQRTSLKAILFRVRAWWLERHAPQASFPIHHSRCTYFFLGVVAVANVDTPNILNTLRHRHENGEVYTNVGALGILISVNPYRWMDIYTPELMRAHYEAFGTKELAPHVGSPARPLCAPCVQRLAVRPSLSS